MSKVKVIFAMGQNGEFCNDSTGKMPWGDKPLPSDSKHFRAFTEGNVVVMGRKTWESLPAPLKGRTHIVLSSSPVKPLNGENPFDIIDTEGSDYENLIDFLKWAHPNKDICFIGGESVIYSALDYADIVSVTVVGEDYPDCRLLDVDKFRKVQDDFPFCHERYYSDDEATIEVNLFYREDPYILAMNS